MNEATRWRFALAKEIGTAYSSNGATADRLRHAADTAEVIARVRSPAVTSTVPCVIRVAAEPFWRALAHDEEIGAVKTLVRPDERCFLRFDSCRAEAYEPLVATVADELRRDLYVTVDEADEEGRTLYERVGFVVNRRDSKYLIATDPEITGLRGVEVPSGFVFLSAAHAAEDRLRVLDDALRQDVPGTNGWRWDEAGFREETFDSPSFDPTTYLIAVEETAGEYVGLVRVWDNPKEPRLGMIGVLPPYRRRGLATALLARAFAALHDRGKTHVSTESDETNVASTSFLESLGACCTGGSIELVRRLTASPPRAQSDRGSDAALSATQE